MQSIWFAILDSPEASPETFLASDETLNLYEDMWAGCCILLEMSLDVVHAIMLAG